MSKTLHEQEYTQVPNLQTVAKDNDTYREFLTQRPLTV